MRAIDLSTWLKEWQPLLGGALALLAACIFAAGSVVAARTRAGAQARAESFPDLRTGNDTQDNQPVDLVRNLEQLRSLVRSSLSALTPSDNSAAAPVGASHQSYERILRLQLKTSHLPQDAPKSAHAFLALLVQHIEALSLLLKKNASASEISNVLIKVNTAARNLLAVLAPSSAENSNSLSTLRQR